MTIQTLPPDWSVTTAVEQVPAPIDIGQSAPRRYFSRWTTTVRDEHGNYVAASGDQQDAISQAISILQADLG